MVRVDTSFSWNTSARSRLTQVRSGGGRQYRYGLCGSVPRVGNELRFLLCFLHLVQITLHARDPLSPHRASLIPNNN